MARQVKVEILGDARGLRSAFREAERATSGFGKTIARAGVFAATGLAGVAAGVGVFAVKSIQAAQESNKVAKQTAAVLKSTGGAAKVTAQQISDLATAISNKTGIDDEQIQSSENMLLTFTNVRNEVGKGNDIFTQATMVLQDMSVALGQDASKGAIQLGKALNDPIKGVSALRRVGVTFTAQQKEQIKTLVESGHRLEAQKIILRELFKEFGGSAAAAATPLDRLKVVVGNLQEAIGNALLPTVNKAATFIANKVVPVLESQLPRATKLFQDAITNLQAFITNTLIPAVEKLHGDWVAIVDDFHALADSIPPVVKSLLSLSNLIKHAGEELHTLRKIVDLAVVGLLAAEVAVLDLANGFLFVVQHTVGIFNKGIRESAARAREDIGRMRDDVNAKIRDIIHRKDINVVAHDNATAVLRRIQAELRATAAAGGPAFSVTARLVHGGVFQHGTSFAPGGLSMLHKGEIVIPPGLSALVRSGAALVGASGTGGGGVASSVYNINVAIAPTADQATVGGQIVQAIKAYERGNGARWRK